MTFEIKMKIRYCTGLKCTIMISQTFISRYTVYLDYDSLITFCHLKNKIFSACHILQLVCLYQFTMCNGATTKQSMEQINYKNNHNKFDKHIQIYLLHSFSFHNYSITLTQLFVAGKQPSCDNHVALFCFPKLLVKIMRNKLINLSFSNLTD